MCRVVEAAGYAPTNIAYTVPAGTPFAWHTDLYERYPGPQNVGDQFGSLVRGEDPRVDVIEAGYLRGDDLVVVERAPGPRDDVHPVRALMHADVFSIPADLWTNEEQERAPAVAASMTSLFRDIVAETSALYGLNQSEAEMPTPSELLTDGKINGDLFISNALLNDDPLLAADLESIRQIGEVEWSTGLYFPVYGPFRTDGITHWSDQHLDGARALRLGESVKRHLDKGSRSTR